MKRKLVTFWRIIKAGVVNFGRNAWLGIAAIAVMVITLTIVLISLVANTTFAHTIQQIRDKIDVSMYLKDSVTEQQLKKVQTDLKKLPNVAGVTYVSKEEILQQYIKDNADNPELLSAVSEADNPLPATIHIKPRDLNKLSGIRQYLAKKQVKALQSNNPSDSGDRREAIDKITNATNILQRAGVVMVLVFMIVSVLIIFNTIQMAIFNRRDELTIMRLLGASTSYIRGPFVVESIMYGVVSALVSVLSVHLALVAARSTLQATSLGLLDINYSAEYFRSHFWLLLGVQLGIGILIGAVSSIVATSRYLKFKTAK